jgi:hypothetical protein
MKRIVTSVAAVLCLTLAGAPAFAQEAIRTGDGGSPPVVSAPIVHAPVDGVGATQNDPQAIGAWARQVLNGAPTEAEAGAAPPARCAGIEADGKPHGEVWAGIGTGGYRQAGGVVTQPLGACGSVTVMIDRTEGGYGHFRQRR